MMYLAEDPEWARLDAMIDAEVWAWHHVLLAVDAELRAFEDDVEPDEPDA
jgi:hypothetical protein